jgi:Tol biopolymer transport system component
MLNHTRFANRLISRRASLIAAAFVATVACALPVWMPSARAAGKPPRPPADPAIAFTASSGSGYVLRVMNVDGSNATTIYSLAPGSSVNGVSWSPDGGSVAFIENWNLCRIDVSVVNGVPVGSNRVVLAASGNGDSYTMPAWSPDGDAIAFVHVQSHSLMAIPASGGMPATLYTPPPATLILNYPAWSPDGDFIAFWDDPDGTGDNTFKLLERATGQVTTAFGPAEFFVWSLDWARTQDALVFAGEVDGSRGVWRLGLAPGGEPQFIRAGSAASWSPDDSQIVIATSGGKPKLERLNLGSGEVASLGSGLRPNWRRNP